MTLNWLLALIPVALVLDGLEANPLFVFLASALAIVPLAKLMADATEVLALALGPTLGGLLNASLGNAPEIIIGLFALNKGLVTIVKASITGSIIGNLLFGLGLAMFAGGLKFRSAQQDFDTSVARISGAQLTLAAFGLIIPTVFTQSALAMDSTRGAVEISLHISVLLLFIYIAGFIFTLQRSAYADAAQSANQPENDAKAPAGATYKAESTTEWSRQRALTILVAVTVALAIMSEIMTGALEPTTRALGLTPLFAGVFLLALVGNAAGYFSAARFARQDQMDISLAITVGASVQIALVVVPLLVFMGMAMGQKMDLVFSPLELVSIMVSVLITRNLIVDGFSNWLEGLTLMVVYFMLGVGFYYVPSAPLHP